MAAGGVASLAAAATPHLPAKWDHTADVVVIGSGASGFPASIVARETGASVILVEAQPHTGGHGTCSGGNVPLGGGTSLQKKYGVVDSPDLLFRDLTDWSVVEPNGFPDYRYNDREVIRAFADNAAATFEFLVAHGVVFVDKKPDTLGGNSVGNSVPREAHAAVMNWPTVQTGKPADADLQATMSSGNGLIRPLEAAANKAGVQILLEHRMTALYRETPGSGRVVGIAVDHKGARVNIHARRAVIIATGGSSGNLNFRRMFDPRLTEEYCGIAGCRGRTRTPAASSPGWRSAHRSGDSTTRWASSARTSPSPAPSAVSTAIVTCAGCRAAPCSTARAPLACRSGTGRTSSW
jgi:succinate dehydrogenase/fumarate reductase flavoprotein subunit